jgi:hypothetical protein
MPELDQFPVLAALRIRHDAVFRDQASPETRYQD